MLSCILSLSSESKLQKSYPQNLILETFPYIFGVLFFKYLVNETTV